MPKLINWKRAMANKKRMACWHALKDLIDGVDSVVAEERVVAVLTVCIHDLNERLAKIEANIS